MVKQVHKSLVGVIQQSHAHNAVRIATLEDRIRRVKEAYAVKGIHPNTMGVTKPQGETKPLS